MKVSLVDATPPVDTTLHAIYRVDLDDDAWLRSLREIVAPEDCERAAAFLFRMEHGDARVFAMSTSAEGSFVMEGASQRSADGGIALAFVPREPSTIVQSALMGMFPLPEPYASAYGRVGAVDCWALGGASVCGVGVGVGTTLPERGRLTKRAGRYWTSMATHMTAAVRLRTAMHAPTEAVLSRDGKVLHAEGIARDEENRESLRRAAKAIDRARRGVDDAVLAIESCSAMVEGRWTLVDEFESDGRRHLIARVNEPKTPDYAGLSLRERQVVALAMNGRATKQIAYELGIAVPTVASYLRRSIRKLGARSRLELVAKGAYFSIL